MSCYMCGFCGSSIDGDWDCGIEMPDGENWCDYCAADHLPEDWEDYKITYWQKPIPLRYHDWEATHKDYDGPEDHRVFTSGNLADLAAQIMDFNEELT